MSEKPTHYRSYRRILQALKYILKLAWQFFLIIIITTFKA